MSSANRKITLAVWLYFLAGSCWILTTDFLLQQTRPDSVWAVSWQSGKGLIFVAGTSVFLFLILRSVVARVATDLTLEHAASLGDAAEQVPNLITPPGLKTPLTIFLVLAATLVMTGVLVHSRFAETIRAASLQNLEQMNEQALQQMESWRRERLGDAATLTADAVFLGEIQNWLAARSNNPPPETVTSRLQALRTAFGYQAILCSATSRAGLCSHPKGKWLALRPATSSPWPCKPAGPSGPESTSRVPTTRWYWTSSFPCRSQRGLRPPFSPPWCCVPKQPWPWLLP